MKIPLIGKYSNQWYFDEIKLQFVLLRYRNQIEAAMVSNNEAYTKYEALAERQTMWEKEVHTKIEKVSPWLILKFWLFRNTVLLFSRYKI